MRDYNNFKARVANLKIDLAKLRREREPEHETIEALAFFKPETEGMPPIGAHSDRTSNVAIKWRVEHGNVTAELGDIYVLTREGLENELDVLDSIIAKVDNAIAALSEDERTIIKGFYIEQKPWYDVAHEVQYAERHCRRLRTRAVWRMSKVIFGCRVIR